MRPSIVLSLALSAAYAATLVWGSFPGHWLVKAMSIASLAWLVRPHPLLVAALLFGSAGDALLGLGRHLFVYGLAAFLCGHVAYTAGFLRIRSQARWGLAPALLGGAATLCYAWLLPGLGSLRVPVFLYMVAITVMVAASVRMGRQVTAGAVLFLISDCVLAANRFNAPVPASGPLVWSTYYFGQLLIADGCSRVIRGVSWSASPTATRK